MPRCTPTETLAQIRAGDLDRVYLITGDDEVEKSEIADAFEASVDEGMRAFNIDRLDGGETSLGRIVEAARTFPMMAQRRIIIVLRAERCLAPNRETRASNAHGELFEAYLEDPEPHACLVLVANTLDKRRRLTSRLHAVATVVTCGVIETLADAEQWVRRRVTAEGQSISAAGARLMAATTGPNINRLRGDLERLLLFASGQSSIGVDDVLAIAGPSVVHDDWAVANAIERKQVGQALRALAQTLEAGAAPYMVLGQLAWVVRTRLPTDRVATSVETVFRTDVALKSSAGEPRVLLERLVVELCR